LSYRRFLVNGLIGQGARAKLSLVKKLRNKAARDSKERKIIRRSFNGSLTRQVCCVEGLQPLWRSNKGPSVAVHESGESDIRRRAQMICDDVHGDQHVSTPPT
jgi:hypothetical protein